MADEKMKKSRSIFISCHPGLGDNLICNGLFREFALKYENVIIPTYNYYVPTIKEMFGDVPGIKVLPVGNIYHVRFRQLLRGLSKTGIYDILRLGGSNSNWRGDERGSTRFDEMFYRQAGLDFSTRWTSFVSPKPVESGQKIMQDLGLSPGEYIFLHEDVSRDFKVNRRYLNRDYPIFTPDLVKGTVSFFDYYWLIRNAAEIHCIESSFSAFIESVDTGWGIKKFAHRYARSDVNIDVHLEATYRTEWSILR